MTFYSFVDDSITLILKLDLDFVKMYLYNENDINRIGSTVTT